MARAMRRLAEDLRVIDVVLEVIDARIPYSGRNPQLAALAERRPRLLILSRSDLADPHATARFSARLRDAERVHALDATSRGSFSHLRALLAEIGAGRESTRMLVIGIPNAGKSTVINGLVGRNVARAEDRAGVTRAAQWFRLPDVDASRLEIMDTAGILPPKIDTEEARWKLALVGAIPRARFDPEDVVTHFADWAARNGYTQAPDLESYAQARGFVRRGGALDTHNAAWAYIKDFNDARFGRITLE